MHSEAVFLHYKPIFNYLSFLFQKVKIIIFVLLKFCTSKLYSGKNDFLKFNKNIKIVV